MSGSIVVNATAGIINCMAAVANAYMLYKTLNNQNTSFKKERFETTLFNIIENHRNFVRGISFRINGYDKNGNKVEGNLNSDNLFVFSYNEIKKLIQIIQAPQYPNLSEEDYKNELNDISTQMSSAGDDITRNELTKQEKDYRDLFELSWRCRDYKIDEREWEQLRAQLYPEKEDGIKIAYKLFYERWKLYYGPYVRSLKLILLHIYNSEYSKEEKAKYFNYETSQMTNYEQFFIKCYCSYDEVFEKMLNTMTDKVKTNK